MLKKVTYFLEAIFKFGYLACLNELDNNGNFYIYSTRRIGHIHCTWYGFYQNNGKQSTFSGVKPAFNSRYVSPVTGSVPCTHSGIGLCRCHYGPISVCYYAIEPGC